LFLVGRRRKRLRYEVWDNRVLGTVEPVDSHRVEILFDGTPVTEVRLVILTVECLGNEPIQSSDFERPLRFYWSEPARILSAEIIASNPKNLRPIIKVGANEIVVEPLLLNPEDGLQMKVLIDQAAKLSVDGRIVGVKRFTKVVPIDPLKSNKYFRHVVVVVIAGNLLLLLLAAGRCAGFWAARSRAEHLIGLVLLLSWLYLLVYLSLAIISCFKNKDRSD
jgi:hypothetical protein